MLKRFVRANCNSPIVDKVELLDVNPTYGTVRFSDGRESSVSLRDLAPFPRVESPISDVPLTTLQNAEGLLPETTLTSDSTPASQRVRPMTTQHPMVFPPNVPLYPSDVANSDSEIPVAISDSTANRNTLPVDEGPSLRRSTRKSRPPERFGYQ